MTVQHVTAVEWSKALLPLLNEGHVLYMPVEGLSMYPLMVGGRDTVTISSIVGVTLKRGDVVLYARSDRTHVVHRIHHIERGKYYMVGDSQTWIEGPITTDNVLAIATAVNRNGVTIRFDHKFYIILSNTWLYLRPLRPYLLKALSKMISIFKGKK